MSLYLVSFKDKIHDPNGESIELFLNQINYGLNSKLTGDSTILDTIKIALILQYDYT
jgi:phosphoribosylformylglycinamidine (FGAM) synthase PurS component